MNLLMVAVNIAVFVVLTFMGNTEDALFMFNHGACYTPSVQSGEYYRLFTSMFLHFGLYHIVNNMVCLIFLGDYLETDCRAGEIFDHLSGGRAGRQSAFNGYRDSDRSLCCVGGRFWCDFCSSRRATLYCAAQPRQSRGNDCAPDGDYGGTLGAAGLYRCGNRQCGAYRRPAGRVCAGGSAVPYQIRRTMVLRRQERSVDAEVHRRMPGHS